jgi:hypothetical protein
MAEFERAAPSTALGGPATERQTAGNTRRASSAIVGLAVAALIVAAALAIGATSGWDSIGSGRPSPRQPVYSIREFWKSNRLQ